MGDTLEVTGFFVAGTVAGSPATVTVPSLATISSSKYISPTTAYNSTSVTGDYATSITAMCGTMVAYPSTSTSLIYFGGNYGGANATNSGATYGNAFFTTGCVVTYKFRIAITL
jgi:hypothetical protein